MKRSLTIILALCAITSLLSCQITTNPTRNHTIQTTIENFAATVESLTEDSTIILTGPVTSSDISIISSAINSGTCKIQLDLTQATGLTEIPERGFMFCSKLLKIRLPSSVTSIGSYAFCACTKLNQINIPSSVTSLGPSAFSDCFELTQITIPSSITSIEDFTFCRSGLTQITIPSSITSIGVHVFRQCTDLTQVTFEQTSGWRTTRYESNFQNKTGGIVIDVSDTAINAANFKDTTHECDYWFRTESQS